MDEKTIKKPIRNALGRGLSSLISGTPVPVAPHRLNVGSVKPITTNYKLEDNHLHGNLAANASSELATNMINKEVVPEKPNSDQVQSDDSKSVRYLDIKLIINNPNQPRQEFKKAELAELSDSIKTLGVLQPILVRPSASNSGKFEIVAGERRWRAATLAELELIPAIILKLDDKQTLEISIVENVQREGLNPIEEAMAYERLTNEFNLSQSEVAERVGKDRASISNITRLLKLPKEVQDLLVENKISVGHAKAILTIKEPHAQLSLARKVANEGLSVRELESIVARVVVLDGGKQRNNLANKNKAPSDISFPEILDRIRNTLGTKVNILHNKTGKKAGSGKIEIEYYSEQELERVIDLICND